MRITRYGRNRKRRAAKKIVIALFLFIVPLAAVAASMLFMSIYNSGSDKEALREGLFSNSVVAFKYNYEMGGNTLYRLELNSSENLSEAEAYIKSIKNKKLNGFILKEGGYKVIYGVFTNLDEAGKVRDSIAKKAEGSIYETKLPSFSLKYNESDSTFIQLVRAADKLIWEVAEVKSLLSKEIVLESKSDTASVLEEIEYRESKLEQYLGYAQKIDVAKEHKAFRDSFVLLLEEVLAEKLDNEKDYYNIQIGLMNQIEAYRRFIGRLLA